MPMRMIPSQIAPSTKSNAERRLFEAFQRLNMQDHYVVVHSLNLPEHLYKRCGELDFLVISSQGLYVLEVKGGRVSCHDGIWNYMDRFGIVHRSSEGPFEQAKSGMYSLENRFKKVAGNNSLHGLVTGFGVVFPDCDYDVKSVEWPSDLVLDARKWHAQGLKTYLLSLEKYWTEHQKLQHGYVSPEEVQKIVQVLRPDFDLVRSLQVEAEEIEGRLVQLTEEQYTRLDIIEDHARILVEGGAGTGKTLLAIEAAGKYASQGKRVLFVCFSPLLATFLSTRINATGVTVRSVHELMRTIVQKYDLVPPGYNTSLGLNDPWFTEHLAPAFDTASRHLTDQDRFDMLIVDEGQDILNLEYLSALSNVVVGGLEKGTWRIFYDPYNQGAIFGAMDQEVITLLDSLGAVHARLSINCRNTDQIVLQTQLVTGADLSNQSTGPGPEVTHQEYQSIDESVPLIQAYLDELVAREVLLRDITILSPLPYEESAASKLSSKWQKKIIRLDDKINWHFPFDGLTFATIAEFKGLENRFIVLIDIEDLDSTPLALSTLYVGMTRARVSLRIVFNRRLVNRYRELGMKNISRLSKKDKGHA